MRLVRIWDYFMRRKLLLLVMLAMMILTGFLCRALIFQQTDEMISEVPKTGELEFSEDGCNIYLAGMLESSLGGGINDSYETTNDETTFWGAEAPEVKIQSEQNSAEADMRRETFIIVTGIIVAVMVILGAKFVFDHYVR